MTLSDQNDRCPGVAFVLPIGLTLGGSNIWSMQMANRLAAEGQRVTLFEHRIVDWHPRLDVKLPRSVDLRNVPGRRPAQARMRDIRKYAPVYSESLPAVFVPNYGCGAYAACALLSKRQPDMLRVIGVGHGHSDAYMDVLVHYEPIIHCFVAVNRQMAGQMAELMPHRAADIVVRSCPVEVPDTVLPRASIPGHRLCLGYAGRITNHEKRCSLLVPLAAELAARNVDFKLRIAGEGPYRATLEHELPGLPVSVQERVHFDGMLSPDRMSTFWAEADISILLSDTESTGLSLLEGMAHGCVPVSTRCGGPEDYILNDQNGFLVPKNDVVAMADVIAGLAADQAKILNLGRKAYETVRDTYSYDQYLPWFCARTREAWASSARAWPEERPLLPTRLRRGRPGFLERIRRMIGDG